MPSTKRSRPDDDENRAECYYTVRQRAPTAQEVARYRDRKARRDQPPEEDKKAEWHWQASPFNPTGFTKSSESMDLKYAIDTDPHMAPAQWGDMTRYNSFVLGKEKFYTDDFVFVANEETVKRQKANDGSANGSGPRRADNGWVARILEIRASDEQHVYARVYWMYWPEELPAGTRCGRKTIRGGRQPYHGQHELVASNHMDVINAVSVTMAAEVNHWIETDEDDTQPALYWRQAYNCNTSQLSPAKEVCRCEMPAHPDKLLIRCSSPQCGKWMHEDCLRHNALMRVYERLGKKSPQIFDGGLDVKKEEPPPPEGLVSPPVTDAEKREAEDKPSLKLDDIKLPLFVGGSRPSPSPAVVGARGRSSTPKRGVKREPYKGLFQAEIRLNDGPTAWQIKDLRSNVDGGSKTWLEQAYCMFCSQSID